MVTQVCTIEANTARHVVLDAGAMIKLQRVDQLGDRFYSTSEVLREVRDKRARANLSVLPMEVAARQPHPKAIAFVKQFAKKTGDLGFLSEADVGIMALAYTLAREHRVAGLREEPAAVEQSNESLGFDWAPTTEKAAPTTEKAPEAPAEEVADADDADSDSEGEWVTEDNFHRFGSVAKADERLTVACATADYSVQNVLLQIGLPVLSFDGYRIRSVKLWAQICRGCQEFVRDSEKIFCPKCGNSTLERVSYSVKDGKPVVHDNRRYAPSKRGTVYSIPQRKGGRQQDILLCEDQMLMGGYQQKLRHERSLWRKDVAAHDPFNPNALIRTGDAGGVWNNGGRRPAGMPRPVAGYGRSNPNSNRFRPKGRK